MDKIGQKHVEIELRSEIPFGNVDKIKERLNKTGSFLSHSRRLSFMSWGSIGAKPLDIRVRITDGEGEVVIKSGNFDAPDRMETSQSINSDQFIGFIKIFSQLGFKSLVGEREIFNYSLPNRIIASVVIAGNISYIELEKLSTVKDKKKNLVTVEKMAKELDLDSLSLAEFESLCTRLNTEVDWEFSPSERSYKKLELLLRSYLVNPT